MGWYVEGVEPSYEGVQHCKNHYKINSIHCGNLLSLHDNGIRFDVAVLWGVLPHIHNPVQTIHYLSEILKPSGKIIVTCANIDSIPAKIMKDRWGHLDLPRHYFMWSPSTLRKLLEMNNLNFNKIIFHDNLWNSNVNLFKLKPLSFFNDHLFSNQHLDKAHKYILQRSNRLLSHPLLILSRLLKKGGMMTAVGTKVKLA